ncbi:MAG TPA: prepilin-type N-terminal cleavage/methylation domain-containing protein [Patescibacteria group bacterium]|jgi:type IV fimbrial biogenesis protein FimT|nr:prepilin-type N-terminal cleavage/methylation domain-containing protein [Patescibacteria group bacterium]
MTLKTRYRGEAGFSLSEILVVVVIIGLCAAVFVPNVGTFYRAYRIHSAADQLTGHMRTARQIAVSQRLPVTLTINPSPANSYTLNYTIPGKPATTQTFKLYKEITVATTPTGPLTFTLNQNGTVANPSTPDDLNPTSNFVRMTRMIGSGRTDQYTLTFSVAGKVGVKFVR